MTVEQFLSEWLMVHTPTVRVRTAQNYASHVKNYINPVIGSKELSTVTPVDVVDIVSYMQNKNIAASTIRLMQTILRQAFDYAVARKYVSDNAAKAAGKIRVPSAPVSVVTMGTLRNISEAIKSARHSSILRLALVQGFRRGEVCALRWADIDFDNQTIRIERQVVRVDGVGLVVQEPKTVTSRRTVPMSTVAYDVLSEQYDQRTGETDWVFPGSVERDLPIDPMRVYNSFQTALDANGLPRMGLHQLRHAFGTILRAQGVSERTLMDLFGHTSTRMTARYGTVVDETKIAAVQTMDTALGGF